MAREINNDDDLNYDDGNDAHSHQILVGDYSDRSNCLNRFDRKKIISYIVISILLVSSLILLASFFTRDENKPTNSNDSSPSKADQVQLSSAASMKFSKDCFYDSSNNTNQTANNYKWPSVALIEFKYTSKRLISETGYKLMNKTFYFFCMGTLIDKRTILTSAQCTKDEILILSDDSKWRKIKLSPDDLISSYSIYLGFDHLNDTIDYEFYPNVVRMRADKIIMHNNFDEETFKNDIALIVMDGEVNFNDRIRPACLPPKLSVLYPNVNVSGRTLGWGYYEKSHRAPNDNLRYIDAVIQDPKVCHNRDTDSYRNWHLQLCAGSFYDPKSTCFGESGAGLFVEETIENNKKARVVAGILSFGEGCKKKNYPHIFTRTSSYLNWIIENKSN